MIALRVIFKVLLFPLSLLLTIVVAVSMFLIERLAVLLNIFSGVMFLAALAGYAQYLFGWPVGDAGNTSTLQLAIFGTAFSLMLSPYGLPLLAMCLINMLDGLNCVIKSI